MHTIRMIAWTLVFVFFVQAYSVQAHAVKAHSVKARSIKPDWSYVEKKLKHEGLRKSFISVLKKHYEPAGFTGMVELNCLLFLRKSDYHGPQVSDAAVESVRNFVEQNQKTFDRAKKKYGVPPSVIASLLWLESRYGDNQGRFLVASAFVNLVQADRPAMIRHLQATASPRFAKHLTGKNRRDISIRAKAKSKWAIGELKSVQQMYDRNHKLVLGLHGSFAGAFGMPQFLPSSYMHYAKSARNKAPDLTRADDAIHSVAHYLKESGWRQSKPVTYEKALFKYNKSKDYGRAILRLAAQADGDSGRVPASRKRSKKSRR